MISPLRVLILEDRPEDAELVLHELRRAGFEPDWLRVDTEAAYLANLDREWDIILADYSLPTFDAPRALHIVQDRNLNIPFIMISGTVGEELAVECVKQGAADYLLKDRLGRLGPAISKALADIRREREKQEAEAALRESEERHRLLFDNASLGIGYYTTDGRLVAFNRVAAAYMGGKPEDFAGRTMTDLYGDEVSKLYLARIKTAVETGESQVYEDLTNLGGSEKWFLSTYSRIVDASEAVIGVQIISSDITSRKHSEAATRESEHFARSILDGLSAHIAILDETGTILAVNQGWHDFAEDNAPIMDHVCEGANYLAACDAARGAFSEGAAEFAAGIRAVMAGTQNRFELEYPCHSPSELRWFVGRVTRVPGEGPARVVVAHENSTQLKLAELKRAEERTLLRTLIDNLPDLIYAKDRDGRFTLMNHAQADQIGVSSTQEALGHTDFDYFPAEVAERFHRDDSNVIQTGQSLINREETVVAPDGTLGWLSTTKVPLRDAQGQVMGLVGIGHDITHRKHAEEQLRSEHDFSESLIRTAQAVVLVLDPEGRIVRFNPYMEELSGYRLEEVQGTDWITILIPEQDQEAVRALFLKAISGIPTRGGINPILTRGGDERQIEWYDNLLKDAEGNVVGLLSVGLDVTERMRLTNAEHEQRVLAEALRDSASALAGAPDFDAIAHTILENIVVVVPHDAANIMLVEGDQAHVVTWRGYPPTITPLLADMRLPLASTIHLRHMLETHAPNLISDTNREPDWVQLAHTAWVQSYVAAPIRSHDNVIGFINVDSGTPGFFTQEHAQRLQAFANQASIAIERAQLYEEIRQYATDLEARVKERTAQLNNARERIEAILNSSGDVIILCRTDGMIDQANPAFEPVFGRSSDDVLFQPLAHLVIPPHVPRLDEAFQAALDTRLPQRLEVTAQRHEGLPFDAELTLSLVVEQSDRALGVVCIIHDISARKQMETELRAALAKEKDLNELKTRFVGMISHDVRTPLAVISSSTEILRVYHDRLDEKMRNKHFDQIDAQVERMVTLLNDVLTISRADAGALLFNPARLDIDAYCQALVKEFEESPDFTHTLTYASAGEPLQLLIDEKLLYQALTNLLSNAIKYSPQGSTVHFELSSNTQEACLRITDSGIGIPEGDLPHLFETFHRGSNVGEIAGTGLGLAIVRRSIEAHGGTVTCESQVGAGTTFTVRLPRNSREEAENDKNPGH